MHLTPHTHRTNGKAWLWMAVLVWLLNSGCQSPAKHPELKRYSLAALHMATLFRIVLYASDEDTANRAAETAFQRIAALEDILSDYDPRSELTRLCQSPAGKPVVVSQDLFEVLSHSQRLAAATSGAFDVTMGPLVQLWRAARKTFALPTLETISAARARVGWWKLRLDRTQRTVTLLLPDMRLDLGGIAKGYAADQALICLRRMGICRAMVAAGGDIAVGDPPPGKRGWIVAIESLDSAPSTPAQTVELRNAGISTSGDTEQFIEIQGQSYSHIVDPTTGLGLTQHIGVTIVAPDATMSDSVATAVSVLGAARGMAFVENRHSLAARIATVEDEEKRVIESRRFREIRHSHY
jgi:thiamine biosynthesis lipoprotein